MISRLINNAYLIVGIIIFFTQTAYAETTTSINQHGITWYFSDQVQYGQFINGDFWVVDSGDGVNIVSISPGYVLYNGTRAENGSMINPTSGDQGYDGILSGEYDASKNVAIGVSESTPLKLTSGQSLVSTISNNPTSGTNNSYVYAAAVLTCLSSAPPEGTFRPGISSTTKTLHNINSVNTGLLKSLALPAGQTRPDISTYANYFQMVWLTHQGGDLVRYMHPAASGLDNYYYVNKFSTAALLLLLDYTLEEKRSLLINYIQLGIDLYSYLEGGAVGWWPDGGFAKGRKWPILFAGLMLNYEPMKNIGQKSGDYLYNDGHGPGDAPSDYKYFGEDGHTFYVTQKEVDATSNSTWISDSWRTSGAYLQFDINTLTFISASPAGETIGPWNPDTRNQINGVVRCRPYTSDMIGMPEWSFNYAVNLYRGDASWGAGYRTNLNGPTGWMGQILAAYIMGAKSLWNHNSLFDYTDRYISIATTGSDSFGYVVDDQATRNDLDPFLLSMWDSYRSNSPVILKKFDGGIRAINGHLFALP